MTARRVAVAANLVALVVVALLAFADARLLAPRQSRVPAAIPFAGDEGVPRRVLLVVVDALRADAAADPALMPALARIAARGTRAELHVGTMLPATLNALVAMIEGRLAPPTLALADFDAPPARDGGVLARLAEAGGRATVAGPALWHERYGHWIDAGLAVDGFPDAGDDRRVERTIVDALAGAVPSAASAAAAGAARALLVAHFGNVDRVAHRHGAASPAYARAVRAADRAIGRLARAAGTGTTVIVTADHGARADGGHAGAERSVRRVPLVVGGPGAVSGVFGMRAQRTLPTLLAAALGLDREKARASPSRTASDEPGRGRARIVAALSWALLLGVAAAVVLAALVAGRELAVVSFALSASLWIGVAAAVPGAPAATATLCAAALVVLACGLLASRDPGSTAMRRGFVPWRRVAPGLALAAALGAGGTALRLLDAGGVEGERPILAALAIAVAALPTAVALRSARRGRGVASGAPSLVAACVLAVVGLGLGGTTLALAAAAGVVLGAWLHGGERSLALGAALALLPGALARFGGETASLSSVDVALAHRLVDTPLGLPGAVATALLRVALPPLALALGWALAAARERDRGHTFVASRATVAPGAFAAVHLGGALLCFFWIVVAADGRTAALGLGGLLRLLNELCWVALGVGLAARAFSAVPSSRRHEPSYTDR